MSEDPTQDRMDEAMDAASPIPSQDPAEDGVPLDNLAAGISPSGTPKAAKRARQRVEDELGHGTAYRMAFLGAGQGGGRLADAFARLGYRRTAAINTTDADFQGLGEHMHTHSLGASGAAKNIDHGRRALAGREQEVHDLLTRAWGSDVDLAMLCVSLGGGSGSGMAERLVAVCKEYTGVDRVGALVSLPSPSEGPQVAYNAVQVFGRLYEAGVSPLVVIDNQKVREAYPAPVSQVHRQCNTVAARLLHVFNQLAAVHSEYVTFDRSELDQLWDSGLVSLGAASLDPESINSPGDLSQAVTRALPESVLVEVDPGTARVAASLFCASSQVLDTLDMEYFDHAYEAVERVCGGAMVHRGLYKARLRGLEAYTMFGGLALPRACLSRLSRKAGLTAGRSQVAAYLGLED